MHTDPIPALKQQIGAELARLLRDWNQWDVATLLGTDQPRVSNLRRGKLDRFSLETLIRYITRMQCKVELRIVVEGLFKPRLGRSPGA